MILVKILNLTNYYKTDTKLAPSFQTKQEKILIFDHQNYSVSDGRVHYISPVTSHD